MYVPFEQLSDEARVWVYQTTHKLTSDLVAVLELELKSFCDTWTSHQQHVEASFAIVQKHFVIMAINEAVALASGCSIDKSVAKLRELEANLGLQLLDRKDQAVAFHGETIFIPLNRLRFYIENGELTAETTIYNTLVSTKEEMQKYFMLPAGKSWMRKYFSTKALEAVTS